MSNVQYNLLPRFLHIFIGKVKLYKTEQNNKTTNLRNYRKFTASIKYSNNAYTKSISVQQTVFFKNILTINTSLSPAINLKSVSKGKTYIQFFILTLFRKSQDNIKL